VIGIEDIRGAQTTHYRTDVNLAVARSQAIKSGDATAAASLDQPRSKLGASTFPADVDLDDQGRVRHFPYVLNRRDMGRRRNTCDDGVPRLRDTGGRDYSLSGRDVRAGRGTSPTQRSLIEAFTRCQRTDARPASRPAVRARYVGSRGNRDAAPEQDRLWSRLAAFGPRRSLLRWPGRRTVRSTD
jgi:hypothetical protein